MALMWHVPTNRRNQRVGRLSDISWSATESKKLSGREGPKAVRWRVPLLFDIAARGRSHHVKITILAFGLVLFVQTLAS